MQNNEMLAHDFAGFWPRFAAYFIDGAIAALFFNASYWLAHQQVVHYLDTNPDVAKFFAQESSDYALNYKAANRIMYYYGSVMGLILNWCYFAGMDSSPLRCTIGNWALGIYVTDLDGQRIDFARASGRFFGKIISGVLLGIGYIMAGITDRKQAMHDKMADCLVMRK
jgi:uncharacterized RDD family membrane protein YckC